MRDETAKHFASLTAPNIRSQLPGRWGDMDLLDVVRHFQDKKEYARAAATYELLLHSPEQNEGLAYSEIYFDLYELLRWRDDFAGSLRWLHAAIMFEEQHEDGSGRDSLRRDLIETYLRAGDFDTGLALATRALLNSPHDVWTLNILALCLPNLGLASLAVEILEHGLNIMRKDDSEGLKDQFEKLRQESIEESAQENSRLHEISPDVLQAFRAALQSAPEPSAEDALYQRLTSQLATADDDQFQEVAAEVLRDGKLWAPELIRLTCDASLIDSPAIERAIMLLRQLHINKTVELGELAEWLEQADSNWQDTLYSPFIGKVHGFTNDDLEKIVLDTQYNFYLRNDAAQALMARAADDPKLSPQIVTILRQLLTRPEAHESAEEETFLGFLISTITNYKMQEVYPEIEAAFLEDRVDPQIIDLAFVQGKWGMPITAQQETRREDGLYLPLKCKACGRERIYFVQHVTVDTGTLARQEAGRNEKYDAHIMDREIVCPKCGAIDQYEMTPMANMRLMIPLKGVESFVGLLTGQKSDEPRFAPDPRVRRFESHIKGRPMHPLEGIERYQKLIAANPQEADSYVRMGNILRVLHRHPQALAAFQKGYELDPGDPDCIISYAMAEHDFGDRTSARKLYQETIELALKSPYPDPYFMEVTAMARDGLQALQKNQASPWAVENLQTPAAPEPPQQRSPKPKRQKRSKNKANTSKAKKKKKRNRRR